MPKKKSKNNTTKLVLSIVILALAILTVCSLFMPVILQTVADNTVMTAKGTDVFAAAFAGEASLEMTGGTASLYALKIADETAFVATVFMWLYIILVCASAVVIVFQVLSLIGLRFKLINSILGVVLVVLAILTFIFALIVASKYTVEGSLGGLIEIKATKGLIGAGIYMLIGSLIAGGAEFYNARV